ncbi:hypothetical protein TNCV_1570501 [Trichonephila clavipes]|uniref:Uncharacterized protein n=1 Tax=Trichonephila clavipes TaxID=2585209 RepID=A0A8X6SK56_TRICX|nr:hypothetical protein TNCV_1570501 [Trichonephila clavipes]
MHSQYCALYSSKHSHLSLEITELLQQCPFHLGDPYIFDAVPKECLCNDKFESSMCEDPLGSHFENENDLESDKSQ